MHSTHTYTHIMAWPPDKFKQWWSQATVMLIVSVYDCKYSTSCGPVRAGIYVPEAYYRTDREMKTTVTFSGCSTTRTSIRNVLDYICFSLCPANVSAASWPVYNQKHDASRSKSCIRHPPVSEETQGFYLCSQVCWTMTSWSHQVLDRW